MGGQLLRLAQLTDDMSMAAPKEPLTEATAFGGARFFDTTVCGAAAGRLPARLGVTADAMAMAK